ncbi:MAG TPA: GNAT family N-acetyltransferase [Tepidisphaeraceae bacterium]|nr:GNAT family N-acetyltransferase [Tepidisphaeraceae bacterium]
MSLAMRWVGEDELDRVAETRMLCYGSARNERPRFLDGIRAERRAKGGDFLLAEREGRAVGTATSLSLSMCIRGKAFSCQGVAYVGAIRTERRKSRPHLQSGSVRTPGVATTVMRETLRMARERQHVVSALMPFRASFYEHFGYGVIERRQEWTIPLSVLPTGDFEGIRFMEADDRQAVIECQRRMAQQGQCDIERDLDSWVVYFAEYENGYVIVDRPDPKGPVHSWLYMQSQNTSGRHIARVIDLAYDSPAAFLRQMHFLGSLRDQYGGAIVTVPVDLPLNLLLRESQVPHRPVSHATAEVRTYTRMQLRVLDHQRLIEGLRLPMGYAGSAVVAVHEAEGHVSRFRLEVAEGRASATPTDASADVECADRTWAGIVTGDLAPSAAVQFGLLRVANAGALRALEALAVGPLPFCHDYF